MEMWRIKTGEEPPENAETRRPAMARATLLSSVWILSLFALLTSAAFDMSRSDNVRVSSRTQVS